MAAGACDRCGCAQGECECRFVEFDTKPVRPVTKPSLVKCYITARLNSDGQIWSVAYYSEPPWTMTKYLSDNYAVLFECQAESFESARNYAVAGYNAFMPELSKKFPAQ